MKKIIFIVASLAVAGVVTSVQAAVSVPYGWYLEANLGKSVSSDKSLPGSVKHTGLGESANFGYKFSTYVAGEVGYTHYANTRIQAPNGANVAKDRHYSYDLAGKLMLPIGTSGIEVFGKAGVGRLNSNVTVTNAALAASSGYAFNSGTHSANGLLLGAGADYAIIPNLLVNAQWVRQQGSRNTGDMDLYSLGLAYIF